MCKDLVGQKHRVLAEAGLRHMVREVLREDLLPGFQDYDVWADDNDEFFTSWKPFKAKVIEIARGMGEDPKLKDVISAVYEHYQVSTRRAKPIAVYADYALQCESGGIKDQLPENGGLILGDRQAA